ncbi:MAG: hypothetical protein KDI42_10850, partial [Gammaproteobacteria bacterium]|nr:hypothetical protein [Gammaproteobacteria bacterium]
MQGILIGVVLLLLSGPAQAIKFDQLFVTGAAHGGQLGEARSVFAADETQLHVRFVYRDAKPGQTLSAHWQLLADDQGRSGEFASADLTLDKAADLGQFTYRIEDRWPIGQFRVTLTEAGSQIVGELDFSITADGKPVAAVAAGAETGAATVAVAETPTPPPFTEIYATPPSKLVIERAFIAADREGERFPSDSAEIFLRLEYRDARPGQSLTAIWEQLGEHGGDGLGVFARHSLQLDQSANQAEFSFRPDPAGSWLPGGYRVTVSDDAQVVVQREFRIEARAPTPIAPPVAPPVATPSGKPPVKPTPTTKAVKRVAPSVLEATLAKGIEDAKPKDAVSEFTNVWRRLLLWTRIDGGSHGG